MMTTFRRQGFGLLFGVLNAWLEPDHDIPVDPGLATEALARIVQEGLLHVFHDRERSADDAHSTGITGGEAPARGLHGEPVAVTHREERDA